MISGLSTHFDTGAPHRLAKSAVLQETVAFHVSIGTGKRSISTQIATLRHLLFGGGEGALGRQFDRIVWVSLGSFLKIQNSAGMDSYECCSYFRERSLSWWKYTAPTSWAL